MNKPRAAGGILVEHFFRRFFDSDTVKVEGETLTTVIRAVSVVAMPSLTVAFFLQNQYPARSLWGSIVDQYFFVLYSFVVMGAVAIFEWEMLFPDRLDFLVLSPLPVKPLQMLRAKAAALAGFLALFIVAANILGALVLPIISKGNIPRQFFAHTVAVTLAGVFVSLFFLALGGVLLCLLGAARFRTLSPAVQMFSVALLLLLMVHYGKVGDSLQWWLQEPLGVARWVPPLWFLGVYEALLHGRAAPAFACPMAGYGCRAILILAALVAVTYPTAWARMRRLAIEGVSAQRRRPARGWAALVNRLIHRPGERAAFHFIGQTIVRNNRYQVYLAMYGGTGLALAIACAVSLQSNNRGTAVTLSHRGLHAVMPLLLFWVIAGLRTAFAFPVNLAAGWVFRISGVSIQQCAEAARKWAGALGLAVMCMILIVLRLAGWNPRDLLVQAVCGLCLCILLTDGFFFLSNTVPFNQPRMPGRTSLPLMLTLYIGVFPPFIVGVMYVETKLEASLIKLISLGAGAVLIHAGLVYLQKQPDGMEEEMEGYDAEFQLLGLSFE